MARKVRSPFDVTDKPSEPPATDKPSELPVRAGPARPPIALELRALVQQAQGGDPTALPRIREILDEHPEIWQHLGDLSALAERAWIAVLVADHPLAVEAMRRTLTEMKA